MVNITIDPQLKEVWQQAALGCVQCRVVVQPSSRQLLEAIDVVCRRLMDSMSIEQIKTRENIAQTRACCTALGKDVKRYRNSAEALNRRVLQGKGLYQINNVVEVNNLISLDTGYSLGSYDLEKLEGDIVFKDVDFGYDEKGCITTASARRRSTSSFCRCSATGRDFLEIQTATAPVR